jgi:replicative DNA helicase
MKNHSAFLPGGEFAGKTVYHVLYDPTSIRDSIETYAELLRAYRIKRDIFIAVESAISESMIVKDMEVEKSANDLLNAIVDNTQSVAHLFLRKKVKSFAQVKKSIIEGVKDDSKNASQIISTGIRALDKRLLGGVITGKSYAVKARPKQGKTAFMGSLHYSMALSGIPVLYVCLEMGEEQIHQRNMARDMRTNSASFFLRKKDQRFHQMLDEYDRTHKNIPGFYIDEPGMKFNEFQTLCLGAIKSIGVKGIFLDQLGLIKPSKKIDSRVVFEEEVSMWLAELAKKHNVFTFYAVQENRTGEIRGGDGPLMNADMVLQLNKNEEPLSPDMQGGDRKGTNFGISMVMSASRFTGVMDIGTPKAPEMMLNSLGPYVHDMDDVDGLYSGMTKDQMDDEGRWNL